eukprot:scaffold93678_cov43-Prasinocladus_malaysianus.AAC.2
MTSSLVCPRFGLMSELQHRQYLSSACMREMLAVICSVGSLLEENMDMTVERLPSVSAPAGQVGRHCVN